MARLAGKVPRDTVTVTVELGSPSQFVPTSIPFGLSSQSLHIWVVGGAVVEEVAAMSLLLLQQLLQAAVLDLCCLKPQVL